MAISFLDEGSEPEQDENLNEVAQDIQDLPETDTIEAPVAPVVAEPVAPVIEQPAVVDAPQMVPLTAVQEERRKRQEAEERFQALQRQYAQPATELPDPYDDPGGYADSLAAQQNAQVISIKLDLSEDMARGRYGEELVDQAKAWTIQQYATRPGFRDEVLSQRNPYDYAVKQYQRDQVASTVNMDEFNEFKAWKDANNALAQQQPALTQAQPQQRPGVTPPPRSQVLAPSAGGTSYQPPIQDEDIFGGIFKKE